MADEVNEPSRVAGTNAERLRKASYVIPRACGLCIKFDGKSRCETLDSEVSAFGSCEFFKQDDERITFAVPEDMLTFLERREYTRSNRHKRGGTY